MLGRNSFMETLRILILVSLLFLLPDYMYSLGKDHSFWEESRTPPFSKWGLQGAPWWLSGLRIRHDHCSGLGHCCDVGSILGLHAIGMATNKQTNKQLGLRTCRLKKPPLANLELFLQQRATSKNVNAEPQREKHNWSGLGKSIHLEALWVFDESDCMHVDLGVSYLFSSWSVE